MKQHSGLVVAWIAAAAVLAAVSQPLSASRRGARLLPAFETPWLAPGVQSAAGAAPDVPAGWRSTGRSARLVEQGSRKLLEVAAAPGEGVVWLAQSTLQDGVIDIELRGRDLVGQSFLGVAFRGLDDRTYEAVYFRPFNFAAADPDRRRHAVQYHALPDHPWAKLRQEHPDQYESAIAPVPDPNDWFRARVVLDGRSLTVFVNGASEPALRVTTLVEPRAGAVGVWVGNNSAGEFANLQITPKR